MQGNFLHAALKYAESGFSVIPVKPDKKPFIKWEEHQKQKASPDEIREWWAKWPGAMIGIVTGDISGLFVLDCDTAEGYEAVQEHIPDSLLIPTARTPRGGWHLYFEAPEEKLTIGAGIIPGVDFRGQGGYIIAPPSRNGAGSPYAWIEGLSLDEITPQPIPEALQSLLLTNSLYRCVASEKESHKKSQEVTDSNNYLTEGRRDNDLFHAANCLVKGGCEIHTIKQILDMLARNSNPPFPEKEIKTKIESALKRSERRERNIAEEVRKFLEVTTGHFQVTDCHAESQIVTKEDKHAVIVELKRLCDAGIIERYGSKRGCYRTIESEADDIDFLNASTEAVEIHWPFGIERYVKTLPKNIIVIAGEPNAGKTAFLLNVIRLNQAKHPIHFFSSEMGSIELRDRLSKFDASLESWSFVAKERASNFADVIKPDAMNIIDFLEVHDEFYKIGGLIKEIYDKLRNGICIIAIQKNKGSEYGLGGTRGLEKARLYLAMEPNKLRIVKGKNWVSPENPNNLQINFKLAKGCKFIKESDWHKG